MCVEADQGGDDENNQRFHGRFAPVRKMLATKDHPGQG